MQLPAIDPSRELAARPAGDGLAGPRSKRVLIVDDNRDTADSLALLLRMCGHDVRTLGDGASTLGAASTFRPDLIVMDIGVPGLDGYTAARRLREDGCMARLAAITGYGQPEDRRRAFDAGFDLYFVKPVDPHELERLLAEAPPAPLYPTPAAARGTG